MQNYRYLTFQPDGVEKDALELGPRLDNLRIIPTVLNIHRVLLLLLLREHRPLQAGPSSPQIIILALLVDCKLVKDVLIYISDVLSCQPPYLQQHAFFT